MNAVVLVASIMLFLPLSAGANYPACLLDKMPGSENDAVTSAIIRACLKDNPEGYSWVLKGSDRGLFSFKDSDTCILKKAEATNSQRAAAVIATACRCMYDESANSPELCFPLPAQ